MNKFLTIIGVLMIMGMGLLISIGVCFAASYWILTPLLEQLSGNEISPWLTCLALWILMALFSGVSVTKKWS